MKMRNTHQTLTVVIISAKQIMQSDHKNTTIRTKYLTVLTYTSDKGPLNRVGETPKMCFSCATTA